MPASNPTDHRAPAEDRKAAGLCAEEPAKREIPVTGKAELTDDEAAIAPYATPRTTARGQLTLRAAR